MPAHRSTGLDHEQSGTPLSPESGQADAEFPLALSQGRAPGTALQDSELLTQGEVFCGEFQSALEKSKQEPEKHSRNRHCLLSKAYDLVQIRP